MRAFLAIAALCWMGCATLPGPIMPLEGPSPEPLGSTTARAYLIAPVDAGVATLGGGLRLNHQFAPDLSLGIEGAYVNGVGRNNGLKLIVGRANGKYSFLDGHMAILFGLGAEREGAPVDLGANDSKAGTEMTADVGLSVGWTFGPIEPYAEIALAAGLPTWSNPQDIGFLYAGVGLAFRPTPQWRLNAEFSSFFADFSSSGFVSQPILVPAISAGYVFGG